ncbi:hypothetical protein [Ruficoccus sp. ZRK36]|uniref:hypothetical protein n=1 Tax=Ruficoccus sp. ZRK36 TaxID=2866311 RepID=UPI001C72C033|nr:hypothetical protein [Ruficoccus sp. ZRK36]QYY34807.1 hypothetical protein K0V07_10900 [Ruficoccus sp. ZRK36]
MDVGKVENWKFVRGFEAARQEGFNDHELLLLRLRLGRECDNEIRRRVSYVEHDIRQYIHWEGSIECMICPKRPDIRPSEAYFVLPVRDGEGEAYSALILPPAPKRWALTMWSYDSEFVSNLTHQDHRISADWLDMMVEEFGVRDEQIPAWASPHIGASVLDIRAHARFRRELAVAREQEARFRLHKHLPWLRSRGLDGNVSAQRRIVIPASQLDYDPDESIYIFEIRLQSINTSYCLISFPNKDKPVFVMEPYAGAKEWHLSEPLENQFYELVSMILLQVD